MKGIMTQDINEPYTCEILGFGEIFEIISVERIRRTLLKTHDKGTLFFSANRDHSGGGKTLDYLVNHVAKKEHNLIAFGYADAPPWKSDPLESGQRSHKLNSKLLSALLPVLFKIWIPLFEGFYKKKKLAHVVWAMGE